MKKVTYNLVKTSAKTNQKSIYVRFGQTKVPTGEYIKPSDWNVKENIPKASHRLHDEFEDLKAYLRPLVRKKDYLSTDQLIS